MKHIGLDCGEFRQPLNRAIDSDRFQADLARIKFDQYASASVTHKLLLPITLDMIGRNPLLDQTPGYQ